MSRSGPQVDAASKADSSASIGRRTFVCAAAGAILAGGLGACASLQIVPVSTRNGVIRLRLDQHPPLMEPGGTLRVQPSGLDHHLFVLGQDDGSHVVVSPLCTHQGCVVDAAADRLSCPCHGSEYDRTGSVTRGPAERNLRRYPTERTEHELVIYEVTG